MPLTEGEISVANMTSPGIQDRLSVLLKAYDNDLAIASIDGRWYFIKVRTGAATEVEAPVLCWNEKILGKVLSASEARRFNALLEGFFPGFAISEDEDAKAFCSGVWDEYFGQAIKELVACAIEF